MAGVGVRHWRHRAKRWCTRDRRHVDIRANDGCTGEDTSHAGVRRQRVLRTGHAAFDVVRQGDSSQGHVARVADGVGPRHRVAHFHRHARGRVRVSTVGVLNHFNRRRRLEEAEVDAQVIRQGHDYRCASAVVVAVIVAQIRAIGGVNRGVNHAATGQVSRHRVGGVGRHRDGVVTVGVGRIRVDLRAVGRGHDVTSAHRCHTASRGIAVVVIFHPQPVTNQHGRCVGVVRWIGVRHWRHRAERRRAGHDGRVHIRANDGCASQHTGHAGMRRQLDGRTDHAAFDVVTEGHVRQRHVARIADGVGPRHWVAHRNRHTGGRVSVGAVGVLNHVNGRQRLPDTHVPVEIVFVGGQQRVDRAARCRVGVAVGGVISALVAQGDDIAGG